MRKLFAWAMSMMEQFRHILSERAPIATRRPGERQMNYNLLVDTSVFIDIFDPGSIKHQEASELLEELLKRRIMITMPAHAWFEVQVTLQRLTKENKYKAPWFAPLGTYPIILLHIDKNFIQKYSMIPLPHIKAGDHIFLAVTKVNYTDHVLVSTDNKMLQVGREADLMIYRPEELLEKIRTDSAFEGALPRIPSDIATVVAVRPT